MKYRFFILLLLSYTAPAQEVNNQKTYTYHLTKAPDAITIDGYLNEAVWQKAELANNFWEMILQDKDPAKKKTEFRVTYDHKALYFAAIVQDSLPYHSTTRKRDANLGDNDGIGFILDPLNQHTNGFFFWTSPQNVQMEDVLSATNLNNMTFAWDNKWFSATRIYPDYWTAEIAIPFTTLRYAPDKKVWGINFYRIDQKGGQYSAWTKIPVNINWNDLGYFGSLIWDAPPPAPGKNISFIPYVTGSIASDKEDGMPSKAKFNTGFDGKVALSTSLNLDLTVNPDFSQIDVDQQVTNLTRFDIFFPEKRTFFLENADLYSDIGYPLIQPFYSRTIGLDKNGTIIPIIGGVRLSGNVNKDLRVAVMNMQTSRKDDFAPQNYTAVTLKRQVLKRSSISAYVLNRQAFMTAAEKQAAPLDQFGRNAGVEARFTSNTTKWKAFAGYHLSIKPGVKDSSSFVSLGAEYSTKKLGVQIHFNDVGTHYYADMGFISRINNYDAHFDTVYRLGFKQLYGQVEYRILPQKGSVVNILHGFENLTTWNPNGTLNDQLNRLRTFFIFKNRSELDIRLDGQVTRLLYYTGFTDKEPLPPGDYTYAQWNVEYNGDYRKPVSVKAGVRQGSFYNGRLLSLVSALNMRLQQWGTVNLYFEYDKLNFPAPYGSTELFLVGPRIEFYFSNNLSWTTFLQYNTQVNNFNVNSRMQWRYKPMSDIFLVYSDNYFSTPLLKNKNRAIVLKANYWLNL